jgi:hypothetical protein
LLPDPTCQQRPAALPCSPARLRREHVLSPPTTPLGAIPAPWSGCRPHAAPSFFLSPSAAWHTRADPPPFPSLLSPRARRIEEVVDASLRSTSMPKLELPSFSTAYTSASLAPTAGDPPSSSLVSVRVPPLRRFTVRPFHPPLLSPFEAALTFLLPHRHCRVVPPPLPATGAPSPPTNTAARSILHHLHAAPPLG